MKTLGALLILTASGAASMVFAGDCSDPHNIFECPNLFASTFLPKPWHPSGSEFEDAKRRIQASIDSGKAKAIEVIKTQAKIEQEEAYLNSKDPSDDDKKERAPEELADLQRSLKAAQEAEYADFNSAIADTVKTYHLAPVGGGAPLGLYKGSDALTIHPWRPHYSENEKYDATLGRMRPERDDEQIRRGDSTGRPGERIPLGGTTNLLTGEIRLFQGAFTDPGSLAAAIFHETRHWLDISSRGRFLTPTEYFSTEKDAYSAEASYGGVFELKDTQTRYFQEQAVSNQQKAKVAENMTWHGAEDAGLVEPGFVRSFSYGGDDLGADASAEEKSGAEVGFFSGLSQIPIISRQAHEIFQKQAEVAEEEAAAFEREQQMLEQDQARRDYAISRHFREMDGADGGPIGFEEDLGLSTEGDRYFGRRNHTLSNDEFIAMVSLAQTCSDVRSGSNGPLRGLGAALKLMQEHASDPQFRSNISVGVRSETVGQPQQGDFTHDCMNYIASHTKPPASFNQFRDALMDFLRWQKRLEEEGQRNRRGVGNGGRSSEGGRDGGAGPHNPPEPRCEDYDLCGHPGIGAGIPH